MQPPWLVFVALDKSKVKPTTCGNFGRDKLISMLLQGVPIVVTTTTRSQDDLIVGAEKLDINLPQSSCRPLDLPIAESMPHLDLGLHIVGLFSICPLFSSFLDWSSSTCPVVLELHSTLHDTTSRRLQRPGYSLFDCK